MGETVMTAERKQTVDSLREGGNVNKLEAFILAMNDSEVGIGDVLKAFWRDGGDLEKREAQLQTVLEVKKRERDSLPTGHGERPAFYFREIRPLSREIQKVRNIRKARTHKVQIAFNQLFLSGKAIGVNSGPSHLAYTYTSLLERAIKCCESRLQSLLNEQAKGQDMRCYLGDAEYWVEQVKQTTILKTSEMDDLLKRAYQPEGELVCVGSYLTEHVWPDRITKYAAQGKLFLW